MRKFRVSGNAISEYFRGTFLEINTTENAVIRSLLYTSPEFSVTYNTSGVKQWQKQDNLNWF